MKNQRMTLGLELLEELKEILDQIKNITLQMERNSGDFYEDLFNKLKVEIENDVENFKSNIDKIRNLKLTITEEINLWYSFVKDENEIKKVLFPFKLYYKKKNFSKKNCEIREKITQLSIENRFIKEKIVNWEQSLGIKALQDLKQGEEFKKYEELIRKKEQSISNLMYILATIPQLESKELNLDDIESFIVYFKTLAA